MRNAGCRMDDGMSRRRGHDSTGCQQSERALLIRGLFYMDEQDERDLEEGRMITGPYDWPCSNNVLDSSDCRIIDCKVPIRNSRWSGTGTVIVRSASDFCMMM